MTSEQTKKTSFLAVAAVILTSFCTMHDMVIIPAVTSIYEEFADSQALANFIVSGPAGIMIITMLLTPKMTQHVSKKTLMTASLVVFALASIFGAAIVDPVYMAFMRALVGLSVGVISTVPMTIISEMYEEEGKRSWIMGVYNAVMTGSGFVLGIVSGYFATTSWTGCYRLYWVTIPILVLWVLFVPDDKRLDEAEVVERPKTKFPWGSLIRTLVTFFLVGCFYAVIYFQVSVYVSENGIGDSLLSGTLSSLGTIGGFVIAFAFGAIYGKLQTTTSGWASLVLAVAFAVLYFFPTRVGAIVAVTSIGAAWGLLYTAYQMQLTSVVPPEHVGTSVSVGMAVAGACQFASTYITSGLQALMGTSTITSIIPFGIVVCIVCGIVEIIMAPRAAARQA